MLRIDLNMAEIRNFAKLTALKVIRMMMKILISHLGTGGNVESVALIN